MSPALVCPLVRGEDLLAAYWDAVKLLDADQVASQFAEGAAFCLGDEPPVRGRRGIRLAFVQLFTDLVGISHAPVALWSHKGLVIDEADVTLSFEDGARTVIPMRAAEARCSGACNWSFSVLIRTSVAILFPIATYPPSAAGRAVI